MAAITEGMHAGEFIGELAMGIGYHTEASTVLSGENLSAGHVVGKVTVGAKTAVGAAGVPAPAGATITAAPTAAITTKAGAHRFQCIVGGIAAASKWVHTDPDGIFVGVATGDTAYTGGGLSGLTIADAGTDPTAGEAFTVTVSEAAASGKIVEYDPTNTNGSQNVYGLLLDNVDASLADAPGVVVRRGPGVVNRNDLTFFSGATSDQKATAYAELLALGLMAA